MHFLVVAAHLVHPDWFVQRLIINQSHSVYVTALYFVQTHVQYVYAKGQLTSFILFVFFFGPKTTQLGDCTFFPFISTFEVSKRCFNLTVDNATYFCSYIHCECLSLIIFNLFFGSQLDYLLTILGYVYVSCMNKNYSF